MNSEEDGTSGTQMHVWTVEEMKERLAGEMELLAEGDERNPEYVGIKIINDKGKTLLVAQARPKHVKARDFLIRMFYPRAHGIDLIILDPIAPINRTVAA